MDVADQLYKLIAILDGYECNGQHLACGREEIIQELERCLIDVDRLGSYMDSLQVAMASQARYVFTLEGEELSEVVQHGLTPLHDGALVRLALNPIALWQLYDHLLSVRSTQDYWIGLMCEAELEARGLPPWSEWLSAINS